MTAALLLIVAAVSASPDATAELTRGFFESPFVVFREGRYYIFLPCVVWASDDPLNFENTFLTVLTNEDGSQRAAIEIVQDKDGQHYIAGYGGPGGGIWLAKPSWRSAEIHSTTR